VVCWLRKSELGRIRGVSPQSVNFCLNDELLMTGCARPPWNQTPLAATKSRRMLHRLHRQRDFACYKTHDAKHAPCRMRRQRRSTVACMLVVSNGYVATPQIAATVHYIIIHQWSFRKTATMRTLACQAEIGVGVQALGRFCGGLGELTPENENIHLQSCTVAHFWTKNGSQCRP